METAVYIIAIIAVVFMVFNYWGVSIRTKGQNPIDEALLKKQNEKIALTKDGRRIAYCVYGKDEQGVPVVVNMHGSQLENGFERITHHKNCEGLQVKGIGISLPGYGFTDQKPGRRPVDWPVEDLQAVLEAENVDQFYITGHSQGTVHAMAAAYRFPERCLGFGLNAPLLPKSLVTELNLDNTIGTGQTASTKQLQKNSFGWYFAAFNIVFSILPPSVASSFIKKGFPKVKADQELMDRFNNSMKRAIERGAVGTIWETAQDVCFDFGFDPRDIKNTNVVVWHADDDSAIPASQGKYLAELYHANYKHQAEGYGHMTYCVGEYQEPATSMIAALLNGSKK